MNGTDKEPTTLSGTSPTHIVLPLELRIAHFRDMLLERGVWTCMVSETMPNVALPGKRKL